MTRMFHELGPAQAREPLVISAENNTALALCSLVIFSTVTEYLLTTDGVVLVAYVRMECRAAQPLNVANFSAQDPQRSI